MTEEAPKPKPIPAAGMVYSNCKCCGALRIALCDAGNGEIASFVLDRDQTIELATDLVDALAKTRDEQEPQPHKH